MSSEAVGTSESSLDGRWYTRYQELFFDDYEKLSGHADNREIEKQAFLSGVSENPTLDYPELDTFNFAAHESSLLELKSDIIAGEENDVVKKIYRTKINETIACVRMLRATKNGDDRKFARYASFVYGNPNGENTAYVLDSVRTKILAQKTADPQQIAAAERLLVLFAGHDAVADEQIVSRNDLPKGETIEGFVENAEEAAFAMREVLAEYAITDWEVVIDTNKGVGNFSVSQETKIITIPSDEKIAKRKITKKKLAGLVAHELKTHIVRRHNGERSKLQLLGLGLDRYIKGEEGVATYAEQQITGAKEFAGVPLYFAVAVAKGFDGIPRDFRQTFAVLKDYRLATLKAGDALDERASDAAWKDCVRIFRGTTGHTKGAVYTKDLAYLGNRDIWQLVSKNSDVVMTFSVGKFDSTNETHVAALVQLGILDEDLVMLEK